MSVEQVNAEQFAALLKSGQPIIVDLYADWCGPCKMIAPEVAKMAAANPSVKVVKIDVDAEEELTETLGVSAMPTFLAFDKTGKEVDRVQGANKVAIAAAFAKVA